MVTETAFLHYYFLLRQVVESLDYECLALRMCHAVGEHVDNVLAVVSGVVIVEIGPHAQHKVRVAVLKIFKGLARGFQAYLEGYFKLLHDKMSEVHVVACGMTIVIKEHVGPEVPRVFINHRTFLGVSEAVLSSNVVVSINSAHPQQGRYG